MTQLVIHYLVSGLAHDLMLIQGLPLNVVFRNSVREDVIKKALAGQFRLRQRRLAHLVIALEVQFSVEITLSMNETV